jgi:hypothetical protein
MKPLRDEQLLQALRSLDAFMPARPVAIGRCAGFYLERLRALLAQAPA